MPDLLAPSSTICRLFLLAGFFLIASCQKNTLFEKVPSSWSGIDFNNKIVENDTINPLDVVNIYNGGGVGVGDFNNDGLQDLYFSGNRVSNRLYLNLGNFKFKDITVEAGVGGLGRWGRGVSLVDINSDGLLDIYVCNTVYNNPLMRRNLLYVNQGADKHGIPHFREMAAEYGLDLRVQSTMASFFDYDNDGQLDMYLVVNEASTSYYPNLFGASETRQQHQSLGRLYHNTWNAALHHPVFNDVSSQAGINIAGLGHAASIADINLDGWKDIYVSNDFLSSNILYINNHDGTFTDRSKEYFKHTSYNAMGQDIVDLNNDGLADVFELDMNPADNFRKKMMLGANNYQAVQNFDYYGYQYQYVRNTLQLNQGNRLGEGDTVGSPAFSEISFLSGLAQTDWSWTPLVTDFNNDGLRDVVVTNGFPKDLTDHDFMTYRQHANLTQSKKQVLDQIPSVKIHNYAFRNRGDLQFEDVSESWGLQVPTFSNGAVYADLNNDGAMDMVINNLNDEALVYKNTSRLKDNLHTNFLQIRFDGQGHNLGGIGAWAHIYYRGKQQVSENNPYRGYLSTDQNVVHFGLGDVRVVDSLVVIWPAGKKQLIQQVKANRLLTVYEKDARQTVSWAKPVTDHSSLFTDAGRQSRLAYHHREYDFADFKIQKLLPHKLSQFSPGLAAADLNGDGLDDILVGGNPAEPTQILFQQKSGAFVQRDLLPAQKDQQTSHDEGLLVFDANGDGWPDIYIASGGYGNEGQSASYQDRLLLNDGKGNFSAAADALPVNLTSKLCVRAFDYNRDGKPDLFVSGRVDPWKYPKAVSSFIFRNDSQNGQVHFTDVTAQVAPSLKNIGLVCDALFSDYDGDGWPDLILAGEWMPVTFLHNDHGHFSNATSKSGISGKHGWWNSIAAGDFRHTGRMDYIVGNSGDNSLYRATEKYPVYMTAGDFEKNGSYNALTSIFLPDVHGDRQEFPAFGRDDLLKEMISMKRRFPDYRSFAKTQMKDLLTDEQKKGALRLSVNTSESVYLRNEGNGRFTLIPLPVQAQVAPLNGLLVDDFDQDGNLDVLVNGNDFGPEVSIGRSDALNGLLLKGDGKGNFKPASILESGFYVPGDGKALVKLQDPKGNYLVAASQNKGPLKLFALRHSPASIRVRPDDAWAISTDKNGRRLKTEFYQGSSFLSQSAPFISLDKTIQKIELFDFKGHTRTLTK